MRNRYLYQLVTCFNILSTNINYIKSVWDKEIENGGYLSDKLYSTLTSLQSILNKLTTQYSYIDWSSEHQSTIKSIYSFMTVNNSTKKQQEEVYGYDYPKERESLPTRLLDSTLSLSYTTNYMINKLDITVKRQGIEKEVEDIFNLIKEYVNFTEEELILNKYRI